MIPAQPHACSTVSGSNHRFEEMHAYLLTIIKPSPRVERRSESCGGAKKVANADQKGETAPIRSAEIASLKHKENFVASINAAFTRLFQYEHHGGISFDAVPTA